MAMNSDFHDMEDLANSLDAPAPPKRRGRPRKPPQEAVPGMVTPSDVPTDKPPPPRKTGGRRKANPLNGVVKNIVRVINADTEKALRSMVPPEDLYNPDYTPPPEQLKNTKFKEPYDTYFIDDDTVDRFLEGFTGAVDDERLAKIAESKAMRALGFVSVLVGIARPMSRAIKTQVQIAVWKRKNAAAQTAETQAQPAEPEPAPNPTDVD